jgi:RNA polymerase sigma-70 factor (ECF subfamily)
MRLQDHENPVNGIENYGDHLYAFALARVRDRAVAEDLVQETLLAALKARQNYSGASSERTWLTAILKHKLFDHFRSSSRMATFETDEEHDEFFDAAGRWLNPPAGVFATPESILEQKELFAVLQKCIDELPRKLGIVFTLREVDGMTSREICELLSVSPENLWVLLHRARLQLRKALESRWLPATSTARSRARELAYAN